MIPLTGEFSVVNAMDSRTFWVKAVCYRKKSKNFKDIQTWIQIWILFISYYLNALSLSFLISKMGANISFWAILFDVHKTHVHKFSGAQFMAFGVCQFLLLFLPLSSAVILIHLNIFSLETKPNMCFILLPISVELHHPLTWTWGLPL